MHGLHVEGRKEGAEYMTAFAIKGELSKDESAPAINNIATFWTPTI